jgi:cytochrome oxidase assembly protein ShyY1
MTRRLPLIPTLLIGLAVAAMVGLGIWQLDRRDEKERLIAGYARAATLPPVAFPVGRGIDESLMFRKALAFCVRPVSWSARAGRNARGEQGWSHVVTCMTGGAEWPGLIADMGWSSDSTAPQGWRGGPVSGVITADRRDMILVSDMAVAGLQPSAPPSMEDIPNNHLAYAVQWFLFAVVAVVIYGLALQRRRMPPRGDA